MNAHAVMMRAELDAYLPLCSDAELEAFLRMLARECTRRDVPDTHRIFDVARYMERQRVLARRAASSEE